MIFMILFLMTISLIIVTILDIIAIVYFFYIANKSKSITNKYSDWVKENWEKDNILAPPLEAQEAINFLSNYLLGEDWYDSSGATHPEQVNARIVHEILYKYSPEYRGEIKESEKNS